MIRKIFLEMSNLFPDKTGLNYTIWIAIKSGREKHGPRIKIIANDFEISMSISDDPEIKRKKGKMNIDSKSLQKIKKFITQNKNVLLDHWNGLIDSADLKDRIRRI